MINIVLDYDKDSCFKFDLYLNDGFYYFGMRYFDGISTGGH